MSMGGVQHSRLRTVRDAGARRRRCPDDKVLILLIILLTEALPCLDAFRLPPPALSLREVLAETSRRPPASSTARRLHRCLVFSKHLLGPRSQRERVVLQGALASKTGASSMTCSFQTFFGDFTVRTFSDADESCFDNVAADIVAPIKVCRASGGEVLCVIRHGDEQSRPLAAASARVLGESAVLETIILADDECEGVERELQTFLVRCLEAVCRHRGSVAHVRVLAATEPRVDADALLQGGYMRDGDGTLQKALSEANGVSASREGEKGSKELLGVVDVEGREIAVLPRAHVERFNLLIPAIGVLVHNAQGQIYVHQRSKTKSMHASYFDMFVGGLPLAGESPREAARNEVGEELGIRNHPLEELFTVTWLGLRNRVILSVFRVCVRGDGDVEHDDGEVVWGKFVSLHELEERMKRDQFVPGGLKAWQETVARGLHTQYLA